MDQIGIYTFLISFAVSFTLIPFVLKLLYKLKLGQPISEDAPDRHASKNGTPTMGGIVIIAGFLAGYICYFICKPNSALIYLAVIIFMLFSSLIGALDDYLTVFPKNGIRGIKSTPKAILQLIITILFMSYVLYINPNIGIWIGGFHISGIWYGIVAVFVVTAYMNFVNITDGLDGLVAGLAAILCGVFAYACAAPFMAALCGACLAFLFVNANPAKAFMGDISSLFIGSGIIAFSIIDGLEIPILIASLIFIIDGFSTVVQWAFFKYTRIVKGKGKRLFLKAPIHHHFEMKGYPEQKIVIRCWIFGVIFAIVAVLLFL